MKTVIFSSAALCLLTVAACADTTADKAEPKAPAATVEATVPTPEAPAAAAPVVADKPLECGKASYYADKFTGRSTASGEPYQPTLFTAAHKTLSFGTKLVVRRDGEEGETTVTVNDRGPFTPGRIIDLSRAAAEEIGLIKAGVAKVCIFAVEE